MMETDLGVHIDLYNLEDVKFEGSKYVLTSPRSLEACSRLDVKPIELLYKPLSEFQEELLPQDIPLRTIYSLYDESEQIRQRKLRLCREERGRIVNQEDREVSRSALQARISKLPSNDFESKRSRPAKKVTLKTPGTKGKNKSRFVSRSLERESPKLHRELLSKKERNPPRPSSASKARPRSADTRKTQRCTSSATLGTKVKYRCGSAPNVSVKLPARDEKILKLMKDRREGEKKDLSMSNQAHRLWEDQRKREEALHIIAENKRRQLLAEENRIKDSRKADEKERRRKAEEEEREIKKLGIQDSQLKSEMSLMNQLRMQELKLSDKIRQEALKRDIQETNLKAREREEEEMKQLLLAKQITDLQSATEKKDVRIHQESLKKFLDNRQEREQFEQRKKFLDSQEQQNQALVRSSMETRLSQAEANLSQVLEQRNQQLLEHHREEQEKLKRARTTHRKLEAEMEAWRYGLLQHKKLMEDRATEVVNRSIELKSWQARKQRTAKELEQKKNLAKLEKEEKKWRRELERSLLQKDRKVDDLIDEKERSVAQTRAMAQLSQTLRDDIKEKYESDTFDKKVLEAQLYANLDRGYHAKSPAPKNRSSIKFC